MPDLKQLERAWLALTYPTVSGASAVAIRSVTADADPALLAELTRQDRERAERFGSAGRRREWAEGRRCELEVKRRLMAVGADMERVATSISHGHGLALAVGVAPVGPGDRGFLGVGVDIEPKERRYHPAAAERVIARAERAFPLGFLDFWVIKEACFKAGAPTPGKTVTQYEVQSYDELSAEGVASRRASGGVEACRFRVLESGGWKIAFAVVDEG